MDDLAAELGLSSTDHLVFSRTLDIQRPMELPVCLSPNIQNATSFTEKNDSLENLLNLLAQGGHYSPEDCRPEHKVGILVPYRNREENLAIFLNSIHPFLIRQNLEYQIFVVEQYGSDLFNRGRLLNAGFQEMQQMGDWPCVVFHDVDLLPTDNRILYTCPEVPRHMCATVLNKTNLPSYRSLFGGVAAMRAGHFTKVNGYSNMYWGWGGEDNNLFWSTTGTSYSRLKASGLGVTRYSNEFAKYAALPHTSTRFNDFKFHILKTDSKIYREDGLSSLQYSVIANQLKRLYTHIVLDINPSRRNVQFDTLNISNYWRNLIVRSQSWLQEYVTERNIFIKMFYFNNTKQGICKIGYGYR